MRKILFVISIISFAYTTTGQESIIKEYAEPRRTSTWMNPICLYPSTLRMANIAQDPNFNAMVNDIDKILIYTLDSATAATKDYKELLEKYEEEGFEEYMTILGKQEMRIIGKEDEYVGFTSVEENAIAFYLRGDIPFGKIPTLLESFQSSDMLPMFSDRFSFK